MKAIIYSSKFKEGTNLKGWLFTIMRNSFINNYRRITKRNTFMDTQDEQFIIDNAKTFNAHNNGESKFIKQDLSNAIDSLPDDNTFISGINYSFFFTIYHNNLCF